jgi:hypothetical protein
VTSFVRRLMSSRDRGRPAALDNNPRLPGAGPVWGRHRRRSRRLVVTLRGPCSEVARCPVLLGEKRSFWRGECCKDLDDPRRRLGVGHEAHYGSRRDRGPTGTSPQMRRQGREPLQGRNGRSRRCLPRSSRGSIRRLSRQQTGRRRTPIRQLTRLWPHRDPPQP